MIKIAKETKKQEKKCWECGAEMEEKIGVDPDGIDYKYWKCLKCGEEVLSMRQLHELAKKEKRLYHATISKWGTAIAIRIPKQIAKSYNIIPGREAVILPEKKGLLIIPKKKDHI